MDHPIELADREYEISYRTVPNWFVPTVTTVTLLVAFVAAFGAIPYFFPYIPIVKGFLFSNQLVLETFFRCVIFLTLAFLTFLLAEAARHDRLLITRDGMSFPVLLAPDLLFRRKRSWDDIANILIGAMLLEDSKGTYEYELEETKDKKKLFIYFKSGGHVCLDLSRMSKKSTERLFMCIESWCISMTRSPQMSDAPKRLKEVKKKDDVLSYTKLWEEQLEAHFSATNFVPLEKDESLNSGRLKVLMQLSSGGLSAVYLAEQANKELAVVKEAVLPPAGEEATREKARELFKREAALLTKLDHPNIAKVLDHFSENGRDYMVLEFVPGHTLRQLVTKQGKLKSEVVVDYAKQIADILDYLHTLEPPVVHRDISPDNILLRDDGRLVLIDFGAANEYVGNATGTLIGKQAYIAPEQLRGKATTASDLYALGATLFYLLTGRDPAPLSVSHPATMESDVESGLDKIVADLTAMEVSERLSEAPALYARLEQMADRSDRAADEQAAEGAGVS